MRFRLYGVFCLLLVIQLANCQLNEDDDGGDGRSYEGDVEEPKISNNNGKPEAAVDEKKSTEVKVNEQEDLRPRSHFTEERFTQLFVPRNSRRKLVSARYTTKPRPTLPSFIKKPISVPPPDFETPATRLSGTSSTRPPASRTTSTTSRPSRGRNRSSSNRFEEPSSTTSTTEAYRRSAFSTRRPSNRLFPNRNRN